jgi:hypothetical protein
MKSVSSPLRQGTLLNLTEDTRGLLDVICQHLAPDNTSVVIENGFQATWKPNDAALSLTVGQNK